MRNYNKAQMEQEVYECMNPIGFDDTPFWEKEAETSEGRYSYDEEELEEEFFHQQLRQYERQYLSGKRWEDIDSIVKDVWSDLYKDVYGVRPRFIPACVVTG